MAGPVLPPRLGKDLLLRAAVAAVSRVRGAGVCLLRNPNGVFRSRSHIPLSLSDRRLSVPPLAGLEGQGHGSLGGGGIEGGVSDSLPFDASTVQGTHPLFVLFPFFHQGDGAGGGNSFSGREGCSRAGSSPFSGLLQLCVHGVEDLRVMETCHRPLRSELLHSQDSIQDGDSSGGSSFGASGRLDGLSLSQGCVLAGSYPSGQPQVPEVYGLWQFLPVPGSLFWSLHGSASFH